MGYTHVMSSFRRPETSSIADIEIDEEGGTLPLRTYGPYRSDYGRLAEFPNLPPLLVREDLMPSVSAVSCWLLYISAC